jgi:hypothetical protein
MKTASILAIALIAIYLGATGKMSAIIYILLYGKSNPVSIKGK